ncbi:hypothetical protein PR048_008345 [Dryococelus australis]|uniref:Transposase n=1 Tax=Dryococelus australis TaxID=614101 RepID=A0ABQ9HWV8_9NEOP|nr:hypothetical protein PR048_008345 [Dryococelus australis]
MFIHRFEKAVFSYVEELRKVLLMCITWGNWDNPSKPMAPTMPASTKDELAKGFEGAYQGLRHSWSKQMEEQQQVIKEQGGKGGHPSRTNPQENSNVHHISNTRKSETIRPRMETRWPLIKRHAFVYLGVLFMLPIALGRLIHSLEQDEMRSSKNVTISAIPQLNNHKVPFTPKQTEANMSERISMNQAFPNSDYTGANRHEHIEWSNIASVTRVPHQLTDEKTYRMETSRDRIRPDAINSIQNQSGNLWNCVRRRQRHPKRAACNSPRPRQIAFYNDGIIDKEFVPAGQTVNASFYEQLLKLLLKRNRRVRPELHGTGKWMLLRDNAPAHCAIRVQFLAQRSLPILSQPPYFPDRAPACRLPFPRPKSLERRTFAPSRQSGNVCVNELRTPNMSKQAYPSKIRRKTDNERIFSECEPNLNEHVRNDGMILLRAGSVLPPPQQTRLWKDSAVKWKQEVSMV